MTMAINPIQHEDPTGLDITKEIAKHRVSLLLSLSSILGVASVFSGSLTLFNRIWLSNTAFDPLLLSVLFLSFGLACAAIYFSVDQIGYQTGCIVLTSGLLITGGYLLLTPWLVSGISILIIAVLTSVILFTLRTSILVFVIAQTFVAAVMVMLWLGLFSIKFVTGSWASLLFQTGIAILVFYFLTVIVLNSVSNALQRQSELRKQLAAAKRLMAQKVDDHTKSLNVTGEVNRLISTILDSNRLVGDVVEQVRQAFDYYHVQIYLLQPEENVLRLAGATGEAGTALLIGQHQIPLDIGVVGQSATKAAPVIVADIKESTDWIENSLLPDTVAEIAVPIFLNGKILGVLDVQNNKPFDLSGSEIGILQTIATQLGTAISNVNMFQEAEEQLKRESILNDLALKLQIVPDIQSSMQLVGKNIAQVLEPISVKIEIDPALLTLTKEQEL